MEPSPRVVELILSGADVNVLNHTTLSLWHFRQLVLELVPSAAASVEPEEDQGVKSPEPVVVPSLRRSVELGEGMSVAAVSYEQELNTRTSKMSSADEELTRDRNTWTEKPALQLQGLTTHIAGRLTPDTRVAAVFKRYRCVLCLDASPSILSIDPSSGRLFLDLLYESVELLIWSFLRPMEVGGEAFTPEIHVSVLVQGALVESLCVLMQGYIVTRSTAAGFLQLIKERFQLIENDWALQAQERGQWGYLGNATPASLDWILQNVVFALHSLPTDCTPMMVLLTDGVVDVRDVYSYDNLLMQLVRHDIQCHFVRIGGGDEDELNATFGFVPNTHLLRFVAEYTGGTVFDYAAIHEACYGTTSGSSNVVKKMSSLQDACFLRKSSVHANSAPVVKLNEMDSTSFDKGTLLPLRPYRMWRDKVHEYRIFADVNRIVEARLREGFWINKIYAKTYQQALVMDKDTVDSPSKPSAAPSNEVVKILIVFLLQWKENVWLEYVVSSKTDNSANLAASASTMPHLGRRLSGQGAKGLSSSSSTRKSAAIFSKDQRTAWSEWHVKINILAYADFLRAFKDTIQCSSAGADQGGPARDSIGYISLSSPIFVQDFIRNVQDVDRVLLHLMTATASINENSDSYANQFSFGTSASAASTSGTPKITSSHPVFNIIGELSTVLWHRWFFVERLEMLCIVKSDVCIDLFYKNEMHSTVDSGNASSLLRDLTKVSRRTIHSHGANVYGTSSGHISIGVESLVEPLIAILDKWSSQKLSRDLFLKFLPPTLSDKGHAPLRNKPSPSSTTSERIIQRRRQRSHTSNSVEDAAHGDNSINTNESNGALCFVRLEFKNKTLCAVNVAFFATRASTRRNVLNDLKSVIFAGINEVSGTLSPAKLLLPLPTEFSVILCHRMLSRLLVTHETLLLHGLDQEPGPFDYAAVSPSLEAEKNAGAIPPSTICCGGSELQLRRVFGAYVWHSSWKWEVANVQTLFDVMRRLHDARISSGFWVLDWKMDEGDGGQCGYAESVIFGREILMEDEKGHTKTALVQYALRRVSDTCLITSFWMEPQHGTIKTRLSDEADHNNRVHWSLKQAIGHSMPFENFESCSAHQTSTPRVSSRVPESSSSSVKDEQKTMEQEDVSSDEGNSSTYLDESELLHLIRDYLFKSDCHFLSCLYTFDCIINLRENIKMPKELSKRVDRVVGSNWIVDRQMAVENGMILPPFSTARLLSTSKRSTQPFLMYLQSGKTSPGVENERSTRALPLISTANENLYSMLELTLRGLSDCEVAWTDYNGDVVAEPNLFTSNLKEDEKVSLEGVDGQLPLWLEQRTASSYHESAPYHALSKGKCFAKLVSDDCVVLAFFPSLENLQVKNKGAPVLDKNPISPSKAQPEKNEEIKIPSQLFSIRAAEENKPDSHLVRMSVSADDIVLYQERRRNFREGYKSWRMGHFQGSRDEKRSYGPDFRKLCLPSTPEDHEFCEDVSRCTPYGCDFHLLIENSGGLLGSGFFQVAFYECSLSRLATNIHDGSSEMLDCVNLPQTIIKHLFSSKQPSKPKDERPAVQIDCSGVRKTTPAQIPLDSNENYYSQMSPESILASRRFRKKVKRAHEHNFSRGVYMALRDGGAVQHSDLLQALSSCIEVPIDVDITLLYHMMETAASHEIQSLSPATAAVVSAGDGAKILMDELTKSFETILASVFIPIPGTKYYYFTGTENTSYDDQAGNEYDLHVLMEESDDGDGDAYAEHQKKGESNRIFATDGERLSLSVNSGDVSCLEAKPEGDADIKRRRRGSLGSEVPIPVVTLTGESSESELYEPNVDEDAEFNKEVAVATSSFSAPFFFRFECRVLNTSREIRSNSADARAHTGISDFEKFPRSSGTAAYDDLQKAVAAHEQLISPSSRRKEFNAFLESLRIKQGSRKAFNTVDVTQIAESFSKVPSGRIALRLVTLTLPNERAFNGGRQIPFDMDSSGQAGKVNALPPTQSQSFSMLHSYQRQVLTQVRNDIKEWCSVKILAILKSANEITPAIGGLVQRLFDDLPEHAVTKATYPLEFVSHSQEAHVNPLDLFKREFEKGDLLNVHHCNGVYFVVVKTNICDEGGVYSETRVEIPYWAYFELDSDHISLQYHHPDRFNQASTGFNRLEVLTRLQLGLRAVCRRVNQFLLLLQLHETRTCNGLLLPADSTVPSSPRSPKQRGELRRAMSKNNGQSKQASFFWPGQFECDLRYSAIFKLHERLAPNFALNMLCTSALEQFQVHNRRHMFVYRDRDGHVFYIKISIYNDMTLPPVLGIHTVEERLERVGIARTNTGGVSNGGLANSAAGAPCIRLEVFGVSEAGEEVTHELCRLLERKLDEGTQVVLMKLLARNTKFQLSPTDLAFLCPAKAEPSSTVDYILPSEVAKCCTLLHYLSQTLKLTPYIRPVTCGGSLRTRNSRDIANLGARRGSFMSTGSIFGLIDEENLKANPHDTLTKNIFDDDKEALGLQDSARVHPACFGAYQKFFAELQDISSSSVNAATRSPIFFFKRFELEAASMAEDPASAPSDIMAQASYVLNLNPDLRLSQGFLSRVGKGLAFMRVDIIRSSVIRKEVDEESKGTPLRVKRMNDIPGLEVLYPKELTIEEAEASTQIMARCQLWIRGSIHIKELSQVMETFVEEALYDFHIEAILMRLQSSSVSNAKAGCISDSDGKMPSDVDALVSLLKSACQLPSSSVTRLGINVHIAPWDLRNGMMQIQTFLNCLPSHLQPAVYAKSRHFGTYVCVSERDREAYTNSLINEPLPHKFRLVVKHTDIPNTFDDADSSDSDAETIASVSSALHHIEPLMRADSVHSENSDLDSVSGRASFAWTSAGASSDLNAISQILTAPSGSSTTSSIVGGIGGLAYQPHLSNKAHFSERDVLLYPSSGSSFHRHREHVEVKRSLYYVVDLSTTKGLQLYGYNMSSALVDALATHLARVLTWSSLREKILRSLLLEKVGAPTATPLGSAVLQPRSLFMTVGKLEQVGKGVSQNSVVFCKDSTIHFIDFQAPVLSILQSNEWFPKVLDASRLRSIDGTALGVYLREAQTQLVFEAPDILYARPRGKSNTNLSGSVGPPSIPDVSREVSGSSLPQQKSHNNEDALSNVSGTHPFGKSRSGGIVSTSNVSNSLSSSPKRRSSRPSSALPHPCGNRSETTARMRGGAGAATALMAARARARGGSNFPNRVCSGPGANAGNRDCRDSAASTVVSSEDSIAPWDLPLINTKGTQLHSLAKEKESEAGKSQDALIPMDSHAQNDFRSAKAAKSGQKGTLSKASCLERRGSRGFGLSVKELTSASSSFSELADPTAPAHRRLGNDATLTYRGHTHNSWRKKLECAWKPRFLFSSHTKRCEVGITEHHHSNEFEEDENQLKKNLMPLPFYCAALEKRWRAFETRSTSQTVSMTLLQKLASLRADEEMEDSVSKNIVEHLLASGHILLHQRFRAAFVEPWVAAEVIGSVSDRNEVGVLRALQSCMDLIHLLSYKREFVFDQEGCAVAKLYTEHTALSMGAGAGADVRAIKQQVAANLKPLRLEAASEFYKEYAVHLRTLGFRRLETLTLGSHERSFSVNFNAAATENRNPGESFSEYFFHSERAAAEEGSWKIGKNYTSLNSASIVILEIKCDNQGVLLNAVLVDLNDLEQQDLHSQHLLAAKAGENTNGVCGARIQKIASWLRAKLQTQALIYGFTIRYFQHHLLQWQSASHEYHKQDNNQGRSTGKLLNEDDALVVTPPMLWKKAFTYQNIVKGLQCFLQAFPNPPEELNDSSPTTESSGNKDTATTMTTNLRVSETSAAPVNDSNRPSSRTVARFARRGMTKQLQQQASNVLALSNSNPTLKPTVPLSMLWRDCVIRVVTVTVPPTLLLSNCSDLIMLQILLRYIACHGSRYKVLDLLQFGTPDAVACHSSSGSFFHRLPHAITPSTHGRVGYFSGGYSLVITTQPVAQKAHDKNSAQLLLLKSTPFELGVENGVLSVECALQEAQLYTSELFRVAAQHYERDLLWSRLLYDNSRGPGCDVARKLALPTALFCVEVGPQQLEECLRLSICTPLETLDPRLDELQRVSGVCWQELALRLRDIYSDQLREYQFQEENEKSSHLLLLCPDAFDLIIHLTFITFKDPTGGEDRVASASEDESIGCSSQSDGSLISTSNEQFSTGDMLVEICRREEPSNKQFTFAQRRSISEFVNSIVHWQWRSLIYD